MIERCNMTRVLRATHYCVVDYQNLLILKRKLGRLEEVSMRNRWLLVGCDIMLQKFEKSKSYIS